MKYLSFFLIPILSSYAAAQESTCYGSTSKGKLENSVKLPNKGVNFESYSTIAQSIGRTYVHSSVKDIIVSAYQALATERPDTVYKYAETGLRYGGQFKPHKTHQNGLSVDFMVPVTNNSNASVHLPTHILNKFGYSIEFDKNSRYQNYTIDYSALAAHLVALDKATKQQGYSIWRVIFDPNLQPKLLATPYGEYLQKNIQFSTKPSWVRHDEHYHVDFNIPCEF